MAGFVITVLFFGATFLAALIAVFIASQVMNRRSSGNTRELVLAGSEGSTSILKDEEVSSFSPWSRFLRHFDFVEVIRVKTAEADLSWSVGRVIARMLLAGVVTL